ncbi:MAG: tyrosine--tRNA ligase [Peptoniphilus sp. oral taxon 375]|uniref:tyrosine--tRNA ligase n=1 Tax=Urinicoccus timonensis TaxID=2024205 RepID=UPI00021A2734|nr:tyrosine--tRNA ligase [Urinicoccus timonensis]EGS29932.1 tyrosine--tRNA ligase [Peptoniphilus sp. oral taxon 375 str. F0436]MBS4871910.1 tyrosine--tRNA ligase [Peptoniphilus sp. oral taxon 375]
MQNVYDILVERGYLDQATDEKELREILAKEPITFYIGFDCTADSLTLGHYLQIMVMQHMQRAGHIPIALIGGGTTMIGDPSGKNDMRKIMTEETIDYNAEQFKRQLRHFLDFDNGKGHFTNNKDWLLNLNFVDFMREIGVHFTVNRMLGFDCYKNRMDQGLTFFEFSYMLMQSYDFLKLYRDFNCRLELGGSDQWSNMIGGYELVRKLEQDKVYAMTFKLLTTAEGKKMGKTESGTIWLDPEKTSPYELFQYMRNVDDRDVIKFMKLLTHLSLEEIDQYAALEGADLNKAKEVLAYEIVKDIHSKEEADKAKEAAKALFGQGGSLDNVPTTEIDEKTLAENKTVIDLIKLVGFVKSNSEGRRLVDQGGITIGEEKAKAFDQEITKDLFKDGQLLLRKGKKVYHKLVLK